MRRAKRGFSTYGLQASRANRRQCGRAACAGARWPPEHGRGSMWPRVDVAVPLARPYVNAPIPLPDLRARAAGTGARWIAQTCPRTAWPNRWFGPTSRHRSHCRICARVPLARARDGLLKHVRGRRGRTAGSALRQRIDPIAGFARACRWHVRAMDCPAR